MGFVYFVIALFAFIFGINALWRIRPFEKGLVERLGKFKSLLDPGLNFVLPFIDTVRKVDMREQVIDVPPQEVITKDNVGVTVDAVIYFKVTDPFKVAYNVANFQYAALKLAQTNLRNEIGNLELDQTLTSREKINVQLRQMLDDATDAWGVKVTRVEIQRIEPPRDITDAMSRQMKAERDKRAAILEAEGFKQAAILKAEGEKTSTILSAEGKKQSQILIAEGEAGAITTVFGAIHTGKPTADLLAVKYLEALAKIADGKATKVFLPIESVKSLGSVAAIAEMFKETKSEELPKK
ncbi:MAG: SPFH/Band 7/PHB domain protein [bacterium]|nr:SPFH/Band 7/PHB domain protein [bacterium]